MRQPGKTAEQIQAGLRATAVTALAVILTACAQPPLQPRSLPPRRVRPKPKPKKDYYRELPPGQHALRKITDPAARPTLAIGPGRRGKLLEGVKRSLFYLRKGSSKTFFPKAGISHARVVASLTVMRELLESPRSDAEVTAELERRFDVYTSVGCDDRGTVLFTGYYTPIFEASKTRTDEFRFPLHKLPPNHVKNPITGETLGLRQPDGSIDPNYPDRETLLESGMLDGHELVWLRNAFEAYLIGVQGSAILRLQSGERFEVGYAGTNGKDYASLGLALVKAGKLKREELNLKRMIEFFEQHPEELDPLAAQNERYIFFQQSRGGPFGCLNEPVEAMISIATDKSIFPRGSLCFLDAKLPGEFGGQDHFKGFMLDQDAGGAIRAPGRCDIFMGVGEEAGRRAGHTLSEGRLYYLFLKDDAGSSYGARTGFDNDRHG